MPRCNYPCQTLQDLVASYSQPAKKFIRALEIGLAVSTYVNVNNINTAEEETRT